MFGIFCSPNKRQLDLEEYRLRLEEKKLLWEISQKSSLPREIVELVTNTSDFSQITERALISVINPPEPQVRVVDVVETVPTSKVGDELRKEDISKKVKKKPRVFISYTWRNSVDQFKREGKPTSAYEKAGPCDPRDIKDVLRAAGHNVWIDVEQLAEGMTLEDQLTEVLNETSLVVACISDEYAVSEMCKREFAYARECKLPIIPVIVGKLGADNWRKTAIKFSLANSLYIEAQDPDPVKLAQAKEKIKKAVNDKLRIQIESDSPCENNNNFSEENQNEIDGEVTNTKLTSLLNAIRPDDPKSTKLAIENIRKVLMEEPSLLNQPDSEGRTPLLLAIDKIQMEVIDYLLQQEGVDINQADNIGRSPLYVACTIDPTDNEISQKKQRILSLLFEKSVCIEDQYVLHRVSELGDATTLTMILDEFSDRVPGLINQYDEDERMPLEYALASDNFTCAWILLSAGASYTRLENAPESAITPLEYATGGIRGFRTLLKKGAQIPLDAQNNPIFSATAFGNIEITKIILGAGVSVNLASDDGETLLYMAVVNGHLELVNFLLECGADPTITAQNGLNSFLVCDKVDVFKALMKNFENINQVYNIPDPVCGLFTILSYSVYCSRDESYIKFLIKSGASLVPSMPGQLSALHYAIDSASDSLVKLIVEAGAEDFSDPKHLFTAANLSRFEIVKYFVERGCDPNRLDQNGHHVLFAAIEGLDETDDGVDDVVETTKYLLDIGANVNVINPFNGRNPLHSAAIFGYEKVAEYLLDRGVNVFARDNDGMRPLDLTVAKSWDSPEDVERKEVIREMIVKRFPKALNLKPNPPKYLGKDIPGGVWQGILSSGGADEVFEARLQFYNGKVYGDGDGNYGSTHYEGEYHNRELNFTVLYVFRNVTVQLVGEYDDTSKKIAGRWNYVNFAVKEDQTFELTKV